MYYFSTITTLCFNYLMCRQVGSVQYSLLLDQTSTNDNDIKVIHEYFSHFKNTYILKHEPRHVVVLGANNQDLQQAEPLFQNYPYVIYTQTTDGHLYQNWLSSGNFVVVFLRNLTEETFDKYVNILSRCTEGKVLFVAEGTIHVREILILFTLAAQINVGFPEFAHFDKNVVKLYGRFTADNCSTEVRLMFVWKPGADLNNINDWAFRSRDRNGCPVSVSTSSFEPKMILETDENGAIRIAGGREGKLVLAVAKKLNFTLALRSPSLTNRIKYSQEVSIVRDVVSGMADMGIGRLRPTNYINESIVKLSLTYDDECITWGVPRIMKWSNNVVSVEFTWRVWTLISLVFVVGCTTGYYFQKISSPEHVRQKKTEYFAVFLDVIAIHLGIPVSNVPEPAGGKFSLIAFLCYATVLTTAYKTSLASILTTEKRTPKIVDAQGIIDANLTVGGSRYDFIVLQNQAGNSEINTKLIERFKVDNNHSATLERLIVNNDFAFLTRASFLRDEQQKSARDYESVSFNVFNHCVLAYHTVMVIRRSSLLRSPINVVIQELTEAGILEHWDNDYIDADKILTRKRVRIFFEKRAADKFKTIFHLYCCCIAICVLFFFIELFIPKFNSWKSQHVDKFRL